MAKKIALEDEKIDNEMGEICNELDGPIGKVPININMLKQSYYNFSSKRGKPLMSKVCPEDNEKYLERF